MKKNILIPLIVVIVIGSTLIIYNNTNYSEPGINNTDSNWPKYTHSDKETTFSVSHPKDWILTKIDEKVDPAFKYFLAPNQIENLPPSSDAITFGQKQGIALKIYENPQGLEMKEFYKWRFTNSEFGEPSPLQNFETLTLNNTIGYTFYGLGPVDDTPHKEYWVKLGNDKLLTLRNWNLNSKQLKILEQVFLSLEIANTQ